MMKLCTMNDVVATVNEEWESALADQIVQRWAHDEPAKYWRASSNFIFFFKNLGVIYVLRFNHARERTSESIQADLALWLGACVCKIANAITVSRITVSSRFFIARFELLNLGTT